MSRIVQATSNIFKKLDAREWYDDEGNIQIQVSINKAVRAGELTTLSAEYADDTALEIAAKLATTSQLSSSAAQNTQVTTQASNQLNTITSQVNLDSANVTSIADSVRSMGQAIVHWPLYTNGSNLYPTRYRDVSYNNVTLTVSGVEDSNYTVNGNLAFFDTGPLVSGLRNSDAATIPGVGPLLHNLNDGDAANLVFGVSDPFSIEFLIYYQETPNLYGYVVDFGGQYQVIVYGDQDEGKTRLRVGGQEGSSYLQLVLDRWNHVVISYDPLDKSATYYLDGEYVARETNIGTPAESPTSNKIRVFDGLYGGLNDLKIYKATLSNSTARNNYTTYKAKFMDFDTGGIWATGATGGALSLMVDPTTGLLDAKNMGRHVYANSFLIDGVGTPATSLRIDGAGFMADHMPEFQYQVSAYPQSYYKLWGTSYTKLPGEEHLTLIGRWDMSTGVATNNRAHYELFIIDPFSPPTNNVPILHASGVSTWTTTNSGLFSLGLDVSTLADSSLFVVGCRARLMESAGETGALQFFTLNAGGPFQYSTAGGGYIEEQGGVRPPQQIQDSS